ncbi:MAG: hypothetical protein KDE03_01610 [Rhodobacteraceae bacterium]|nr:hypothetical protein [Paracoccaceae bacterium]
MVGDPNAAVRAYLNDFVQRPTPGFAVLLAAPWGAGKTHLIRRLFDGNKANVLFVSLFGAKDEEGARNIIARELLGGANASKNIDLWNKAAGPLKKFTGLDLHASLSDVARLFPLPDTIIFDDLERSDLDENVLLGLINVFVERDGKKVILLANEERLWKAGHDQKEKIVGQTLRLVADVDAALPTFIDELPEPTQAFARFEIDTVRNTFTSSEYHNLRSLRQALFDFHRLYSVVRADLRDCADGMRELLRLFLALTLEVKKGALAEDDLRLRDGIDFNRKPEFEALRKAARKYDWEMVKSGRHGAVLNGALSARIICGGQVDAEALNQSLIASERFLRPEEQEWQTVCWAERRDPDAVSEAFGRMEQRFIDREYTTPGIILHVFNNKLYARKIGLNAKSRNVVEKECHDYIRDIASAGKLEGLSPDKAHDFDESGYGGLGYPHYREGDPTNPDTEMFWKLHDLLKKARVDLFNAGLVGVAHCILSDLSKQDVEAVAARLWRSAKGKQGDLRYVAVLMHADARLTAATIARLSGPTLHSFGYLMKERFSSPVKELDEEVEWLRTVISPLKAEAKNRRKANPVHAWQIDALIRHSLEPVLANWG